jgi:hypothetical protein
VIKHRCHKNEHKLQPQQIHGKADDFETNQKQKFLIENSEEIVMLPRYQKDLEPIVQVFALLK